MATKKKTVKKATKAKKPAAKKKATKAKKTSKKRDASWPRNRSGFRRALAARSALFVFSIPARTFGNLA
jgi:hypothetical protein